MRLPKLLCRTCPPPRPPPAGGPPPPSRPGSQNTHTYTYCTHPPTTHPLQHHLPPPCHDATTQLRAPRREQHDHAVPLPGGRLRRVRHHHPESRCVWQPGAATRLEQACAGPPIWCPATPLSPPALPAHRRVCAASLLEHRAVPTAAPCPPFAAAEYFIPAGILLKCFLEVTDRELYDKLVLSVAAVSTPTPLTAAPLLPAPPCFAVAVCLRRCGKAQGYRAAATASQPPPRTALPAPPLPAERGPLQLCGRARGAAAAAGSAVRAWHAVGGQGGGGLGCIGVNLGRECLPEGWDFVEICEPGGRGVGGSGAVHGSRAAVSRVPAVERCATRLARGPTAGPSAWSTWATCSVPRWTRPPARRTTRHAGPPAPALPLLRWPGNSWPLPRLSGCCCCRFGHPSRPLALPPDRRTPVVLPAGGGAAAAGPCVHPPGLPSGQAAADGADASQAVCAGERGAGPPAGASRLAQRSVGRSTA